MSTSLHKNRPRFSQKSKPANLRQPVALEEPTNNYLLSLPSFFQLNQLSAIEKIAMIRHGISKAYLEHFKSITELAYDRLAQAFSVTRATLINKKGADTFGSDLSEKIVSLADIYSYGYEVFGDPSVFNTWVLEPNRALGGLIPFDLLDTQYGREEVKNIIGRIEYGVYS